MSNMPKENKALGYIAGVLTLYVAWQIAEAIVKLDWASMLAFTISTAVVYYFGKDYENK